ncbi:type III secretion system inner membrane ring lipoprotein SctJ [Limnobacter alexandrii]|jgi:type III secretion protein J|uniref:type III secretion system inner membrane ring lipoprotein SctJ n=1 Tax=Limnobacter alexandrii TaxID=2570352 RepID=UPI0014862651|nr:type III secretion inner membrane ring lipoprotein SctJ [Limnobacter alexandrii]
MQLIWVGLLTAMLLGCTSRVELLNGLEEREANKVLSTLLDKGIDATKITTKTGLQILVPQDQISISLNHLNNEGLPRRQHDRLGDVFKKDGLISSPMEERARYIFALSQELENTLSFIDGVINARVHVVLPERTAPGEPIKPSSAAVFIKHSPRVDLTSIITRIKQMVKNSIPGLDSSSLENISVVMIPSQESDARSVEFERLGGFIVEKNSATKLGWLLFTLISLVIILIVSFSYLIFQYWALLKGNPDVETPESIKGASVPFPRSWINRLAFLTRKVKGWTR